MSKNNEKRMDWEKAENHIKECLWQYFLLHGNSGVFCGFALGEIKKLQDRYDDNERTEELFNEMMGVE